MPNQPPKLKHIKLTSHPGADGATPLPVVWGAEGAKERGPIIAAACSERNAIGTHSGSYAIYRALAVASGSLDPEHRPDLTDTKPVTSIGPHKSWAGESRIISLDPFGHLIAEEFREHLAAGVDIRPTIAITKAHLNMPELVSAVALGRLKPDGKILKATGDVSVVKAAIEPVWYLPGVAERFGIAESNLRRSLFECTGGMFPELITRPDINIFLPPIGGMTVYIFGDIDKIPDESVPLSCRVHDECNGSDVFGSDICTCRPYLAHGIEMCIETAQKGGSGVIVYNRKEGRALGEVTKFLVYNARKRQQGGDTAAKYFERTECVAGVQDMRFQEMMPDVLQWLGITKIHNFVSMSNLKHDAVTKSGITIVNRVSIPDGLIPKDAQVEMDAKKAAGYYTEEVSPDSSELAKPKGRSFEE